MPVASIAELGQGSDPTKFRPPMDLYFIETLAPGRLATAPRPRSGERLAREMARLREKGVEVLASLLSSREVTDLGLDAERDAAAAAGLEFLSFPIEDHGVPASDVAVTRFTAALAQRIAEGKTVAVHCRAGIGRSSLMAAVTMMRLEPGLTAEAAAKRISRARGLDTPETAAQKKWLKAFRPRM
jgi:protein-tyrosine phosphatase